MPKTVRFCGQFALSLLVCLAVVIYLLPALLLILTISQLILRFPKRDKRPDEKGTHPTVGSPPAPRDVLNLPALRILKDENEIMLMMFFGTKSKLRTNNNDDAVYNMHAVKDVMNNDNAPSLSRHCDKAIYAPETTFLHAKRRWFPV